MAKLKTGRHTSALKAHRQSLRHAEDNRTMRSRIRTLARKVEEAIEKKDATSAKQLLQETFSLWDRAAKKGVIHKNAASRKKARLSQRLGTLQTAKA